MIRPLVIASRREGILCGHGPSEAWLDLIEEVQARDDYTFELPLEGRAGPWVRVRGRDMLLLSSYDYLGLIGHPKVEGSAIRATERYGTSTGGVRLLTGTNELHRELEARIAARKQVQDATVFTSGYLANLSAVCALFGPRDRVLLDERCHRSAFDACRMAHVPHRRFRHGDLDHLDAMLSEAPDRRTLVMVEGVYSMDGDICPLPEIVEVKNRRGAFLMVDEAHSFGVLGATGRGVHEELGVPADDVDVWMGSLSKAIPAGGGYLAGSAQVVSYLKHGSAAFMFSAALTPASAGAALGALDVLESEPWRIARSRSNARLLREGLRGWGIDTGSTRSPVVPALVGDRDRTLRLARRLAERKVLTSAVVSPAVPVGHERLRLCATAAHSEDDLAMGVAVLGEVWKETLR